MFECEDVKAVIGITVKELRTLKGLTQEQLAECLGLQTQTVNKIEAGKTFISCEVLVKLCNFFNAAPAVFFTEKVRIITEENLNYIDKIKQLLPYFDFAKLREIYDILLIMQK